MRQPAGRRILLDCEGCEWDIVKFAWGKLTAYFNFIQIEFHNVGWAPLSTAEREGCLRTVCGNDTDLVLKRRFIHCTYLSAPHI